MWSAVSFLKKGHASERLLLPPIGRSFPRSLDFTDMNTVKTALLVFTLGSAISFAVAGLIMVISRVIHFAEQRADNKR